MRKPQDLCEIKLSKADVLKAIEAYLNKGNTGAETVVQDVKNSRSKNYMVIAEIS